jgi:MATE family multidrug resistance protein
MANEFAVEQRKDLPSSSTTDALLVSAAAMACELREVNNEPESSSAVRTAVQGETTSNVHVADADVRGAMNLEPSYQGWQWWWLSPWGPGPLIRVALPLMISAGFFSLTLFTDRTLLYWQTESSAAAAMGAGSLFWCLTCLPMGLLGYLSTFVSQYRGADRVARIGVAYQHSMALAFCVVPFFLLAILLAHWFFAGAGHAPALVSLETNYLRILLLGGIGFLFYSVQSGLLTGDGRTPTVLAIDCVGTVVNLVLDAVLIFGFGPIPAFGIEGAAIATAVSFWLRIPLAHRAIYRDRKLTDIYGVGHRFAWDPGMFRRLITFGAPAGLQLLAEAGCFAIIMLQVGRLGELEMAATTLALGLNVLAFVPMIGLGIGVGVLVGLRLTEGRVDLAKRTVTCALMVTLLYTGTFAALLGLASDWMIGIYAWGASVERFEEMRPLLVPLLRIIAVYCILDGIQVVFVGAIKGAGDTWFVLLATFLISCSAVIGGLFCQYALGPSLQLWWYVIAVWVGTMGLAFSARYLSGQWQSKRVIEADTDAVVA